MDICKVDALLNSVKGRPPVVEWVVQQFEELGYASWAHRIVNTAGYFPHLLDIKSFVQCMDVKSQYPRQHAQAGCIKDQLDKHSEDLIVIGCYLRLAASAGLICSRRSPLCEVLPRLT